MKSNRLFSAFAFTFGIGVASGSTAQSAVRSPDGLISELADRKLADRGRIAEEIAKCASFDSGRAVVLEHISELIPLLRDKDDSVRYWVAITLGYLGAPAKKAVPALIIALDERVDTFASKSSESGIRFALDRIDPSWRSRPDVSAGIKRRWPK